MNPLRKIIQKTGFDFHRYRQEPNHMAWLRELNIKTILDVGANKGQFAKEIRKILPEAFIYSFEPIKNCFEKLNDTMRGDKKFKSFNFALGENNQTAEMNRNEYSPSSSILEMAEAHKNFFPHTVNSSLEQIIVKKLNNLEELKFEQLEKEVLLKIDTQGYEDKVLKGAENLLSEIKVILIETSFVELYKEQPLFQDIYKFLEDRGFSYKGAVQQKLNKENGEVISEDSLFVRNPKVH